jgi:SAM-dependent methyltransferase
VLIEELQEIHERSQMVGWDFSRLDGRLRADEPWWDFDADCLAEMRGARHIVDLGTGGGERLIRLLSQLPTSEYDDKTVEATEGWEPNIEEATRNLSPFNVIVHRYDSERGDRLPFEDNSIDLVMSRHESIDPSEIARVLTPGGRFMTQQVDGRDATELHQWFDAEFLYPDVSLATYSTQIESEGMHISVADDWTGTMEFADIAALVEYMGLVPWDVPGFKVTDHADVLLKLSPVKPIQVTQRRFRIYADNRISEVRRIENWLRHQRLRKSPTGLFLS